MSPDDPVSTKVSTHKRRLEKKNCVFKQTHAYIQQFRNKYKST